MEENFSNPNTGHYHGGNHTTFHEKMMQICVTNKVIIDAPELITNYQLQLELEKAIYKSIRRSQFTEKKAIADNERDTILTGMTSTVRSATKHFDPSIRDNAKHVLNLIDSHGDLANADYNAETAGIDSLIAKLNGKDYIAAVEALAIMPWLVELEKYNTIFKGYVDEAEQELVEKPSVKYRDARKETDKALRKIVKRVSSLIDINGPEPYRQFISEYNVHVNLYNTQLNEHYGRLHAKMDISNAEITTIPVQPYTGKPIYVIPVVKVRKTERDDTETIIELEFSKDFTVGYKNNVAIGTATLIITGIGKYSGDIITTFNIE
jgi:hypothetical protein